MGFNSGFKGLSKVCQNDTLVEN